MMIEACTVCVHTAINLYSISLLTHNCSTEEIYFIESRILPFCVILTRPGGGGSTAENCRVILGAVIVLMPVSLLFLQQLSFSPLPKEQKAFWCFTHCNTTSCEEYGTWAKIQKVAIFLGKWHYIFVMYQSRMN